MHTVALKIILGTLNYYQNNKCITPWLRYLEDKIVRNGQVEVCFLWMCVLFNFLYILTS